MTAFVSHFRLQRAIQTLRNGGVIAYPTEGVWGLGCDPENPEAVLNLLQLKQRPMKKGLILVAANIDQLEPYLRDISKTQRSTLQLSWPGPNTWLVPANEQVPYWITGDQATVALRVSAHPLIAALCKQFGGVIVSTSANLSGKRAAKSLLEVQLQFSAPHAEPVTLVPGSLGDSHKPTAIRDLMSGNIIRH